MQNRAGHLLVAVVAAVVSTSIATASAGLQIPYAFEKGTNYTYDMVFDWVTAPTNYGFELGDGVRMPTTGAVADISYRCSVKIVCTNAGGVASSRSALSLKEIATRPKDCIYKLTVSLSDCVFEEKGRSSSDTNWLHLRDILNTFCFSVDVDQSGRLLQTDLGAKVSQVRRSKDMSLRAESLRNYLPAVLWTFWECCLPRLPDASDDINMFYSSRDWSVIDDEELRVELTAGDSRNVWQFDNGGCGFWQRVVESKVRRRCEGYAIDTSRTFLFDRQVGAVSQGEASSIHIQEGRQLGSKAAPLAIVLVQRRSVVLRKARATAETMGRDAEGLKPDGAGTNRFR